MIDDSEWDGRAARVRMAELRGFEEAIEMAASICADGIAMMNGIPSDENTRRTRSPPHRSGEGLDRGNQA